MGTPEELNGKTLELWRERLGYSQREACEVLGCSRDAWRRWETGKQKPIPRYIGLAMAALALGMKPYGDLRAQPAG
jgi:transcriptional regulator with XRE-family HTH domain